MNLTCKLREDNSVFAFFVSPSGNGLKVFFKTNDTADNHSKNTSLLMKTFERKYGIKPDEQVKDISRLCFVSDDPNLYLNEHATIIDSNQKVELSTKLETIEFQVKKSFNIDFIVGQRNSYLLKFASVCRNYQISREALEKYCLEKFESANFKKDEILGTISSAYSNNYYEDKSEKIRKKNKREEFEQALCNLGFNFRYNIVTRRAEMSMNGNDWVEVDDRIENDIIRLLDSNGFQVRQGTLRTSINSSFAKDYNPFIEYLSELQDWDGEDYIKLLYDTLNVSEDSFMFFKKWFISIVASILDVNYQNQTVLLLIGSQGVGKSRWLQKLIPPKLKDYFVQGIFDPRDKDTKILMSENLIGNLDELDSMGKSDIPKYKEFITSPGTKVRAAYGRNATIFPRRISFCGSVNSLDFLQDLTGSRRFICIEISTLIDHNHNIDMDKVFGQALSLYKQGHIPYFTMEEIGMIEENNKKFQAYSIEEELLLEHFEKDDNMSPNSRMGIVDIINVIVLILPEENRLNINPSKLGKILSRLGYKKVKTNGNFKYCIRRKKQ
jgi:hypothetical protein